MGEDNGKIIYENLEAFKKDIPYWEGEILKKTKPFLKKYIEKVKKMGYELEITCGGSYYKKNRCIYESGFYIKATKDGKDVRYYDGEPDLAYVAASWGTLKAKKRLFKNEIELIIFKYDEEYISEELDCLLDHLADEENIRII